MAVPLGNVAPLWARMTPPDSLEPVDLWLERAAGNPALMGWVTYEEWIDTLQT